MLPYSDHNYQEKTDLTERLQNKNLGYSNFKFKNYFSTKKLGF